MRFYTKQHQFYCGVDLHADAMYVCILNAVGEIVVHKNIPTKPKAFLRLIKPYHEGLIVGCECMFTWYWLSDLCADEGIDFVLGHALYMRAIHGGKAKNDKIDSHRIAVLLRGGTFPLAYAYPAKMRATRDLLRRRNHLARKRAELIAHIQNTASQYNLPDPLGCVAKPSQREGLPQKFKDPIVRGMVEIEDIARFPRVQDFISYCRLVKPAKESNGKSYGHSGKRIGNAHLRWAFGEAIILMLTGNKPMQQIVQKMASHHGKGKALAILSARLGRAVYYMLKNQVPFDQELFLRS